LPWFAIEIDWASLRKKAKLRALVLDVVNISDGMNEVPQVNHMEGCRGATVAAA
jgi:hypothetical protein